MRKNESGATETEKNIAMPKKVLVYPCGTEIGLEIHRAVHNSIHFELIGGSCSYDHGRFVYETHIDHLPFITDDSDLEQILRFNEMISGLGIDCIYPAMDGVLTKFAEYREYFSCEIIAPDINIARITRSKSKTYELFGDILCVPKIYNTDEDLKFPLYIKPDVGQGAVGTHRVNNPYEMEFYMNDNKGNALLMEYLPGAEYTVDCFTNNKGELIYAQARGRKRIKGGISVNAEKINDPRFSDIAAIINGRLQQRGGWFFQVKENEAGELALLEVASRIAGASSYARCCGINLPLMTLFLYNNQEIDSTIANQYNLELDRALYNAYAIDIQYSKVYVDYDDTLMIKNKMNKLLIAFIHQCIEDHIPVVLITKHRNDIEETLKNARIKDLFDEVIHLNTHQKKHTFIREKDAILIDDSYGERLQASKELGINVFDTHMVECLIRGCLI